jgi:hypothetical protein
VSVSLFVRPHAEVHPFLDEAQQPVDGFGVVARIGVGPHDVRFAAAFDEDGYSPSSARIRYALSAPP